MSSLCDECGCPTLDSGVELCMCQLLKENVVREDSLRKLAKDLRQRAKNAFGWMEGADLEDFLIYEGQMIAYSAAYRMLLEACGKLPSKSEKEKK